MDQKKNKAIPNQTAVAEAMMGVLTFEGNTAVQERILGGSRAQSEGWSRSRVGGVSKQKMLSRGWRELGWTKTLA